MHAVFMIVQSNRRDYNFLACSTESGTAQPKRKNYNTRLYEMQYAKLGAFVILHLIRVGINYYECFMANAKFAEVTTKAEAARSR